MDAEPSCPLLTHLFEYSSNAEGPKFGDYDVLHVANLKGACALHVKGEDITSDMARLHCKV